MNVGKIEVTTSLIAAQSPTRIKSHRLLGTNNRNIMSQDVCDKSILYLSRASEADTESIVRSYYRFLEQVNLFLLQKPPWHRDNLVELSNRVSPFLLGEVSMESNYA
jgi:hypothetical protein